MERKKLLTKYGKTENDAETGPKRGEEMNRGESHREYERTMKEKSQ